MLVTPQAGAGRLGCPRGGALPPSTGARPSGPALRAPGPRSALRVGWERGSPPRSVHAASPGLLVAPISAVPS
eukprot:2646188-Alexandrium_andersonii.AAC.1